MNQVRHWRKKILALGGLTLLACGLAACGGNSASEPADHEQATTTAAPTAQAGAGADAEALYKSNCLSCHGGNLEGKIGPSLAKVGGKLDEAKIAAKINNGGGGMPAFKSTLKEQDVQALAAWLSSKK
ncbi:cytochrome c [Paenibacillus athensensis]|uniref:Cytochrome c domain-containing protein n=1 Tax=Paenibacillus athensensis TaxID=1967502 RepID=A0A4Y8PZV0_9BACL|nr:cytochrome c [Paenibacillus athensensis]MCD1261229.1 cytochrome c [Paenibacillus athensensis]